jgi:hypothetical protein
MNREVQNDRAKLILHRLVARRLGTEPELVDQARLVLGRWKQAHADRGWQSWIAEWESLLGLPVDKIRNEIVRRTERADRLRLSSPFALVPGLMPEDVMLRKRIWRIAKRGAFAHSPTSRRPSSP